MKILILGGTGAMGKPLSKLLSGGAEVYVTSRSVHDSDRIVYIKGNAHDLNFLNMVLSQQKYDAVIDFMSYQTEEFKKIVDIVLANTGQYVFLSSARVYAESKRPLTESSPRLLDVCNDKDYLVTDEYALAKARQENILCESSKENWTIVRPSITYNCDRLQWCIGEKEEWLWRGLKGKSIIFPKDMINVRTTMTYGGDVALAITKLIGNRAALGQIVHIAGAEAITWEKVLNIYQDVLKEKFGYTMKVHYVENWHNISIALNRYYQLKYARSISREFNNDKLKDLIGDLEFIPAEEGLKQCLLEFFDNGQPFKPISWRTEAYFDILTQEKTHLGDFSNLKAKIAYMVARYTPYFAMKCSL